MPLDRNDIIRGMGPRRGDDGGDGGGNNNQPPVTPPPATPAPPPYVPPSATDPSNYDTNISAAQWQAWEANKAPASMGCPPGRQYVGRSGQCASKPDDCPDGQQVVGNDASGTAKCVDSSSLNKPSPAATPTPAAATAAPLGPATSTPQQVVDPLASAKSHASSNASGLGGASPMTGGIQDPRTQPLGGPMPAQQPGVPQQQKRKPTGLGSPSPMPGQIMGTAFGGMH